MKEMLQKIDHTQLKAFATEADIKKLCEEAIRYETASVCIPPAYIPYVKNHYEQLTVCTVIGFPLGYSTTETKVFETKDAIEKGAEEIDMVINIGMVKNGQFNAVLEEIKAVREACIGKTLKVIIENCYLTDEEKIRLCRIVTTAGADFIKTSTGFGTSGATIEDIRLMKENIGPDVKIKAAGGIRTKEAVEQYIREGCERVGASSTADFAEGNIK